jgi:hypothetical protein
MMMLIGFAVACLSSTGISRAQTPIFEWHPNSPLSLGSSLDLSDPLAQKDDAVVFTSSKAIDSTSGTPIASSLDITEIHSVQELQRAMKFDAGINARYLFFSGNGAVDLSSSFSSLDDSLVWVISASVDYGKYRIEGAKLSDAASAKYASGDLKGFKGQYGTGFVRTVRRGAFLSAIFSMNRLTQQQQSSLSNQLQIGAQAAKAGGSVSLSNTDFARSALEHGAISFHYFGTGGPGLTQLGGVVRNVSDFDTIAKTLSDYVAGMTADKAVATEFDTVDYASFFGLSGIDVVPTQAEAQLKQLMDDYFTAEGRVQRLDDIVTHATTTFSFLDQGRLALYKGNRDQHKQFLDQAIKVAADLKAGKSVGVLPVLPDLLLGWPNPTASASYTFWHENQRNNDFTDLYVNVFNGWATAIRVHKADGSIQEYPLSTSLVQEFAPSPVAEFQSVQGVQIVTIERMAFAWPGQVPFTGLQVDVVSPHGSVFASATVGAPTRMSR